MQKITQTLIGILMGITLSMFWISFGPNKEGGSLGSLVAQNYYSIGVNTTATATPVSSVILATSTARNYAAIVNSSTTDAYLGFGQPAVVGRGYLLKASGGTYVIDSSNLFVGAVYAIVSSGTTTFTVLYDK